MNTNLDRTSVLHGEMTAALTTLALLVWQHPKGKSIAAELRKRANNAGDGPSADGFRRAVDVITAPTSAPAPGPQG